LADALELVLRAVLKSSVDHHERLVDPVEHAISRLQELDGAAALASAMQRDGSLHSQLTQIRERFGQELAAAVEDAASSVAELFSQRS
jgi:hypothetical protein